MLHAYDDVHEMILASRGTPGSPIGDIWVSQALVAKEGWAHVREHVRRLNRAAYEQAEERRRARIRDHDY